MFANTFQSGFISVFYSVGSNPLSLWDKAVKNGHIRRIVDDDVKSLVLEISGTNVATTYITCPIKPRASLGIKLPFLVMVIKNLKKYFTFEIQILDDKDMHRRFRVSNFQSTTKVRPFCTTMPIGLSEGWNQIQFNLADFTKRAYGSTYIETMRVQVHANVRIRRIYFSDRLYGDDEMPNEFKLFLPIPGTQRRQTATDTKRMSKSEGERKEEDVPSGAPPTPVPEEADDTTSQLQQPPPEEQEPPPKKGSLTSEQPQLQEEEAVSIAASTAASAAVEDGGDEMAGEGGGEEIAAAGSAHSEEAAEGQPQEEGEAAAVEEGGAEDEKPIEEAPADEAVAEDAPAEGGEAPEASQEAAEAPVEEGSAVDAPAAEEPSPENADAPAE